MSFTRLLVGVDFSETSLIALDYGRSITRENGAELEVIHVHEPPVPPPMAIAEPIAAPRTTVEALDAGDSVHESRRTLQRTLEARGIDGTAKPLLRVGDPALTIAEVAQEEHCDLVIVGTHGRSGLSRVLLGSVAEKVVRHSPCPVLVVPRDAAPPS